MSVKISLNLPPRGLIIRDFILTTLAYICREADANMEISPAGASIYVGSIEDLARAYAELLKDEQDLLKVKRLSLRSFYPRGERTKRALSVERLAEHKAWIEKDITRIRNVIKSITNIEWSGPAGNRVINIGENPNISAPLLFKVNYYSGKRAFLSSRYRDAKIVMDQNSLLFACIGATLSYITTLRVENKRTAIYVPVLDPGAIELQNALAEALQEIRGRFAPDVVFKVLIGFKLRVSGMLPLSMIAISEGRQRPALLFYQEVSVEDGILRFVKNLNDQSREMIMRLLAFTLRNWDTADKNQRAIIRTGFELAQSIYMASTGAMKPADVIYRLARSTYATTSDEFGRSLIEARYSPIRSLDAFRRMILDVREALDRCLAL